MEIGNVLSLFDGMSCAQIALNNVGVKYDNYFASEINKPAMNVTMSNYPNTIQLGDVTKINGLDLPKIDLLVGGSPCQGFSTNGKMLNFQDPRSKLFFEFVRLKEETKPKWWFLENVKMEKSARETISNIMGVEPIVLNSSIVSAQNRVRLYWTNIPFLMPQKTDIRLKDIIDFDAERRYFDMSTVYNVVKSDRFIAYELNYRKKFNCTCKAYFLTSKSAALTKSMTFEDNKVLIGDKIAYLTIDELEELQTVPKGYTKGATINQRAEMLGNGWTVKVVECFFKNLGLDLKRPSQMKINF